MEHKTAIRDLARVTLTTTTLEQKRMLAYKTHCIAPYSDQMVIRYDRGFDVYCYDVESEKLIGPSRVNGYCGVIDDMVYYRTDDSIRRILPSGADGHVTACSNGASINIYGNSLFIYSYTHLTMISPEASVTWKWTRECGELKSVCRSVTVGREYVICHDSAIRYHIGKHIDICEDAYIQDRSVKSFDGVVLWQINHGLTPIRLIDRDRVLLDNGHVCYKNGDVKQAIADYDCDPSIEIDRDYKLIIYIHRITRVIYDWNFQVIATTPKPIQYIGHGWVNMDDMTLCHYPSKVELPIRNIRDIDSIVPLKHSRKMVDEYAAILSCYVDDLPDPLLRMVAAYL